MKKVAVIAVLLGLVCAFPVSAKADNWGLGVKLGVAENDPKSMKDTQDEAGYYGLNSDLEENNGVFGLEALYEFDLNDNADKLGVKLGMDFFGENKLELTSSVVPGSFEAKENTFAVPLTVYYKKDNGLKHWSPFVGAGLSLFRTELKVEDTGSSEKVTKSKVAPHIMAGAEYRFSPLFALGLEAKYNFSAEIKKDGDVLSDHSGFGGAITGRFYF